MSEVPKSDTGIHATADATNPFAPIDYTSRLKAPSRHTGTFHAMQPLQPGQLYGTAHWMSPPKPLSPRPLPQKSEELPPAQGFPSFSAPFPPYEDRSPAEPAPENVPAAPSVSDIPPYLKGGPLWSAQTHTLNRRTKPPWSHATPRLFKRRLRQPKPVRRRRLSLTCLPPARRRPIVPGAAAWRVISWRRRPFPAQRLRTRRSLNPPSRIPCRPCRRCRPAFPSLPPVRFPPSVRVPCSPPEASRAPLMRRRFIPALPTGPTCRRAPPSFHRSLSPSRQTKRMPFWPTVGIRRLFRSSPLKCPRLRCGTLFRLPRIRMPRRGRMRTPAFLLRTCPEALRPEIRPLRRHRSVPSVLRFAPHAWPH